MHRPWRKAIILLGLALSVSQAAWADGGRPAARTALEFADWLFDQGEYVRAAGEYYRWLYTAPESEKPGVMRSIGRSYLCAAEYKKALLVFEKIIAAWPAGPLAEEAYYQAAFCSFKLGEYEAASTQIRRRADQGGLPPPFLLLDGANRLLAGDWEAGGLLLRRYLDIPDTASPSPAAELLAFTEEAKNLPVRSAWAAGLFSVFLPGLGKIYAGRWEDGLVSFILCGFFGGLAAYTFWSEGSGSFKAWMYTALGGVFYIGNIWGSAVAADQFNAAQKTALQERMKSRVEALFP